MKFFYLLIVFTIISTSLSAQHQRIIHRTFEMDTATILELDLYGEYTAEPWVGNAIMIETQVSLSNAPEGIFNHYIKEGRYEIEEQREGETLRLVSKDKNRQAIKSPNKDSEEKVVVKVFIPDAMKPAGDKRWERPKEDKKE